MQNRPPRGLSNEDRFALNRLKNQFSAAEGTNLPPRQTGEFRVPFVSSLRVIRTEQVGGQTRFTIAWEEPNISNISRFNIYAVVTPASSTINNGPFTVQGSPAIVSILSQDVSRVTFTVQIVLNNGLTSTPFTGPTCTGTAVA